MKQNKISLYEFVQCHNYVYSIDMINLSNE